MMTAPQPFEEDEDLFSGEEAYSSSDEEVGFGKGNIPGKGPQHTLKRKRRSKKGQGQHRRNLWTHKVSHIISISTLLAPLYY